MELIASEVGVLCIESPGSAITTSKSALLFVLLLHWCRKTPKGCLTNDEIKA